MYQLTDGTAFTGSYDECLTASIKGLLEVEFFRGLSAKALYHAALEWLEVV